VIILIDICILKMTLSELNPKHYDGHTGIFTIKNFLVCYQLLPLILNDKT
jgi:hypothetical protein